MSAIPTPTATPGTTCAAHRYHRPKPIYCEQHHVVPQAWQLEWEAKLWDPTTTPLCPTGHRNVHWWLARFMRVETESPEVAWGETPGRGYRRTSEQKVALLGMERWLASGRTLLSLREAGLR